VIWSFFGELHDFFGSGIWVVIQLLGAGFLILCWAATVFWVRKDAKRRIESRVWIQLVTFLEDVRERQLEIEAIERRFAKQECPVCRAEIDADFLVCPVCTKRLRQSCAGCLRPLESGWFVCPYCETPVETREVEPWPTATETPPRPAPRASRTAPRKAT
jgi:hypothetical protein